MEEAIKATQIAAVRKHLESGKSITPLEAYDLCGTIRLGAIIYRLRHRENMPIKNLNSKNTYARYTL